MSVEAAFQEDTEEVRRAQEDQQGGARSRGPVHHRTSPRYVDGLIGSLG